MGYPEYNLTTHLTKPHESLSVKLKFRVGHQAQAEGPAAADELDQDIGYPESPIPLN